MARQHEHESLASLRRAVLTVRVLTLCANQLRDSNIIALGSSMGVLTSRREVLRPSVVLVRRWPEFWGASQDTITNPHAVIEVVSATTSERERRRQLAALTQLPSLEHYVLIRVDSASVEHHQRDDGVARWRVARHGLRGSLFMESIDVDLPLNAIYSWK